MALVMNSSDFFEFTGERFTKIPELLFKTLVNVEYGENFLQLPLVNRDFAEIFESEYFWSESKE